MIGRTVGHYRIVEKVGGGGMGEVYLAEDTRLHRRVAVKVLPPVVASDPEHLERFTREAKALAGMSHPNIVTVYSVEDVEDRQLLVMELIEGQTLSELIPEGGLTEERFFELAVPLADAVSAAHAKGITHRDLKPSNVMVTEEGRVKVVDFGLAELRQEAEALEQTVVLEEDLTEKGRILGTFPYMSPEQIKGQRADHRSDIFSLGILLYEMATGERPFAGETSADLISTILRDTPPPAHEIRRNLPRHLDRILAHCLEKDPDKRFQTAKDLRNELESLRDEVASERLLRSTSTVRRLTSAASSAWRRSPAVVAVALALVATTAAIGLWWSSERGSKTAETTRVGSSGGERQVEESRPSVAVFLFRNLTGDPELEWLRAGLADMLVTDLSQSPHLRVLSTDRLHQILEDLGHPDDPAISFDTVQEVARLARVRTVVLGSFARAGETLQVSVNLQNVSTGEVLAAQRLQGAGEPSVFSIVDRLSARVRTAFDVATTEPELQRKIQTVTTSSVEAYQAYLEGMRLRRELDLEGAISEFERATELDSSFGMAYARLASIHETLGREERQRQALDQAFRLADHLPSRERFFVEGSYYGRRRETYGQSIEIYRRALELYPDHDAARYQLGHIYSYLELFEKAAGEYEELLRRGYEYDGVYNALATMYGVQGDFERGYRLLEEWSADQEPRWSIAAIKALLLTHWGRPNRAIEEARRADELRPGSPFVDFVFWHSNVLLADWPKARAAAREIAEGGNAYWTWRSRADEAIIDLYLGQTIDALRHLDEALAAFDEPEPMSGAGAGRTAETLWQLDRPAEVLTRAEQARRFAPGDWPAWEGLFWAALAEQRLGRPDAADALASELQKKTSSLPGNVEERLHHRLLGLLAAERGNAATAIGELERARSMLPARGVRWHRHRFPDHVPIWYELASVYRKTGRTNEAAELYRRIIGSSTERVVHPIQFVRSHYFLAQHLEDLGDREGARDAYGAFVDYWRDGEIDRDRIADARQRLTALGRTGG